LNVSETLEGCPPSTDDAEFPTRPLMTQLEFRPERQIAGITLPTRIMIATNSTIFQPPVTGAIAAIASPSPMMQTRSIAS